MQSLIKFKEFYDKITATTKRTEKLAILEKYKEDEDIKYYLNFLLNDYITTGISDKKLARFHQDSCIDTYSTNIFNTTREALEYLKQHNTGDFDTIDILFSYYMQLLLYDVINKTNIHLLFEKIISKNLPLGVDAKTVNKVIQDLIPVFNVQLANKYFEKSEYVEGKQFTITTKLDGNRIIAIKKNGNVKFFTRQGKEYIGLVDLYNELKNSELDNIAFDGELIADRLAGQDSHDQFTKTQSIALAKDNDKHGVRMRVFDVLPAEDFEQQKCSMPYILRRSKLDHIFKFNCFTYFVKVPVLYSGKDTNKIVELLNAQVANGEEGIMININDALYQYKRTNDLLKVKLFNDTDLVIIGFEMGKNKNADTLGAFICDYKGYELKVGTGLKDGSDFGQRDYIWAHQNEWLGKKIIVKYFEETEDKYGNKSLRFPVYLGPRVEN